MFERGRASKEESKLPLINICSPPFVLAPKARRLQLGRRGGGPGPRERVGLQAAGGGLEGRRPHGGGSGTREAALVARFVAHAPLLVCFSSFTVLPLRHPPWDAGWMSG